ncbi:MaoC family dehydratase [Actinomycetospora chibensis]|uniref:MaoC family dehydratase n=1 Tax=Actinomycetospora chibensis TaxID=663606 RepID=A0ABV9RFG3_9PSEU|nr:MaoC family dehydratase [Actinomycetospora chibensis]MDD7925049.1 MaoC family dehydratase [Actinomycetospora chibensis]
MTSGSDGPYFDDLTVGLAVTDAPAATLTEGRAAAHQAIVGDRLRLALDDRLASLVSGGPLAHPAFVWDTAIGQSTLLTRRVVANLFYRGLVFHRLPRIGDTLSTTTEVVGLAQNRSRPSGLAALRITTVDQAGRTILDFWRCAMLPLSSPDVVTGHADDLAAVGAKVSDDDLERSLAGRDLAAVPASGVPAAGEVFAVEAGDVVSSAPELARLTLNVARVHHDHRPGGGRRLVYGGHTIGIALAQVTRAIPGLVTVLAWEGCDHTGPVHEGDTLTSRIEVVSARPGTAGGTLLDLRSVVSAISADDEAGEAARDVLDWRFCALAI